MTPPTIKSEKTACKCRWRHLPGKSSKQRGVVKSTNTLDILVLIDTTQVRSKRNAHRKSALQRKQECQINHN